MQKKARTTLSTLTGPTAMTALRDQELALVTGGVNHNTKWTFRPPQDPDDIFRLVDE
jgi:hypothetical protein